MAPKTIVSFTLLSISAFALFGCEIVGLKNKNICEGFPAVEIAGASRFNHLSPLLNFENSPLNQEAPEMSLKIAKKAAGHYLLSSIDSKSSDDKDLSAQLCKVDGKTIALITDLSEKGDTAVLFLVNRNDKNALALTQVGVDKRALKEQGVEFESEEDKSLSGPNFKAVGTSISVNSSADALTIVRAIQMPAKNEGSISFKLFRK